MLTMPSGMQDHMNSGVTTLCWCWKLTRSDGVILGFTDHDVDVTTGGQLYQASSGFSGSAVDQELGLSIPTMDVEGVLTSAMLTEADLAAGLWDNAAVELRRVNWGTPSQALLKRVGTIGEVSRTNFTFKAELRALAHTLNQPKGRTYGYTCDATLGDSRCTVDTTGGLYTAPNSQVTALVDGNRLFTSADLGTFPSQWFTGGKLTWTGGANTGYVFEVRLFTVLSGLATIELWLPPPKTIVAGNHFSITVGCDKIFGTCRYKFQNVVNFRGFPYMPSNDRVFAYPDPNAVHDGGSLYE